MPNGEGEDLSLVDEYGINDQVLPVVRDIVHLDKRCVLDIDKRQTGAYFYGFDATLVGYIPVDDFNYLTIEILVYPN